MIQAQHSGVGQITSLYIAATNLQLLALKLKFLCKTLVMNYSLKPTTVEDVQQVGFRGVLRYFSLQNPPLTKTIEESDQQEINLHREGIYSIYKISDCAFYYFCDLSSRKP